MILLNADTAFVKAFVNFMGSDFMNKSDKKEKDVKPIKYTVSNLEKTLKLSNDEIIAKAIRDLLIRDKE